MLFRSGRPNSQFCPAGSPSPAGNPARAGGGFGGTVAQRNAGWQGLELIGLNIEPRQLARSAAPMQQRGDNRIRWIAADA